MIKQTIILVLGLFLIANSAFADRRFLFWNKNEVLVHPWKKVSIDVAEKIQYSVNNNATDIYYGELFLSHAPVKWFEYGGGFRIQKSNLYPGWLQENRSMLIANFSEKYKNFGFKFSNRFEYRSYERNSLDHFRYRQEFKIDFPSLTKWGMQFYTSEESFYKLNGLGLHLARFYGGLSVVQVEHFKLRLYYALEKYKLVNWNTGDIAGLNMSFDL